MKRLLITGAGGFLGSHLVALAKEKYDVFGVALQSKVDLPDQQSFYFNIENKVELLSTLNLIQPNCVIHCAAISGESGCRNFPERAYKTNVESATIIAKWCESNRAKMIFTSTDLVYDGENAPYDESAVLKPSMEYGKLKVASEEALQEFDHVTIARLPLLYGIGKGERKGLLGQFIEQNKQGIIQNLFEDEFRTPACVDDIAKFLIQLLDKDDNGILNLGGEECVSRYELGNLFCKFLQLDPTNLNPIKRADINMDYRPANTCMNSDKAYSIGYQPRKINVALTEIYNSQ